MGEISVWNDEQFLEAQYEEASRRGDVGAAIRIRELQREQQRKALVEAAHDPKPYFEALYPPAPPPPPQARPVIYAYKGEIMTCENGHHHCLVTQDVELYGGAHANKFRLFDGHGFYDACPVCGGATYDNARHAHFFGGVARTAKIAELAHPLTAPVIVPEGPPDPRLANVLRSKPMTPRSLRHRANHPAGHRWS